MLDVPPPDPLAATVCEPELPAGGGKFFGDPITLRRLADYASAHSIKLQNCGSVLLLQGRPGMDEQAALVMMKKVEAGEFGDIKLGMMEAKGR